MNIRRATTEDFLPVAALDRVAWGLNRNATYIPDGEHAWRLWVEHALVYVADMPEVVGAILAFPCLDGRFCVHKIIVDHAHRKQGLGTALFRVLLEVIDRNDLTSFLTVDPENKHAIMLYENMGYHHRELIEGFYRPEEDRLVLTRKPHGA